MSFKTAFVPAALALVLFNGLVTLIVGAVLGFTAIFTGAEVVECPWSSSATAVKKWAPREALLQESV